MDDGAVPQTLKRGTLARRAAAVAGVALFGLAIALLVRRGIALGDSLGGRLLRTSPSAFATALGMYVGGSLLLGFAWSLLVRAAAGNRPRGAPLFVGHLCAQLAKYLPGNVFHLAYRHLAARREGVGHRALGAAFALESVLLIAAAAILAAGVVSDPRLGALAPWTRNLVWVAPLLVLSAWLAISLGGRRLGLGDISPRRTLPALGAVLALDLAFFTIAGGALRLLCDQAGLPFAAWVGWLALAWMVGYVTPGAPAGLGLREAVLGLGLAPVLGAAEALAIALLYRLVTVLADAVLAGIGFVLLRWSAPARALHPRDGVP